MNAIVTHIINSGIITENEFNNLLLDNGTEYLNRFLKHDPWSAQMLRETTVYWMWWVNQFNHTNRVFWVRVHDDGFNLRAGLTTDDKNMLNNFLVKLHAIDEVTAYPSRVVLQKAQEQFDVTYMNMVQIAINHEKYNSKGNKRGYSQVGKTKGEN